LCRIIKALNGKVVSIWEEEASVAPPENFKGMMANIAKHPSPLCMTKFTDFLPVIWSRKLIDNGPCS
jgi:hypothetical protein